MLQTVGATSVDVALGVITGVLGAVVLTVLVTSASSVDPAAADKNFASVNNQFAAQNTELNVMAEQLSWLVNDRWDANRAAAAPGAIPAGGAATVQGPAIVLTDGSPQGLSTSAAQFNKTALAPVATAMTPESVWDSWWLQGCLLALAVILIIRFAMKYSASTSGEAKRDGADAGADAAEDMARVEDLLASMRQVAAKLELPLTVVLSQSPVAGPKLLVSVDVPRPSRTQFMVGLAEAGVILEFSPGDTWRAATSDGAKLAVIELRDPAQESLDDLPNQSLEAH